MKFGCLASAAENAQTVDDCESAWSQLSASEVRELTGGEDGNGGGKLSFNRFTEFHPLYWSAVCGNVVATEFFLVRQ